MSEFKRCFWVNMKNPVYIKYHDEEWSRPCHEEQQLYELRHEVIESQIKHEAALKLVEEYKEQVAALQRKVVQLEAERERNNA